MPSIHVSETAGSELEVVDKIESKIYDTPLKFFAFSV